MPEEAIIWCWPEWTESMSASVNSCWPASRWLRWETAPLERPPRRLLAPSSPFSISNCEKTERRSTRGRGGRRRTSKRHADDAQGFLSGFGRGDWRSGGFVGAAVDAAGQQRRARGRRRHVSSAQFVRRRLRENP